MSCHLQATLALLLGLLSAGACLSAGEPQVYDDLEKLLDESSFVVIDDNTFQQSRAGLLAALNTAPLAIDQDEWSYLRTDTVASALAEGSPDQEARLDNLVEKLNQDFSPFEDRQLLELRRLARRHRLLIDLRDRSEQLQLAFQLEKESLRRALREFQATGGRDPHRRLAAGIRWMQDHEMAGDFVDASKQHLSFPNLEVTLPASLLRSATMTELPTRIEPIDRTSDGIRTHGTVVVTSHAYLAPISSVGPGNFNLQFAGEFMLNATNTRQRIQFRSQATTKTTGVATIAVDDDFFFHFDGLRVCATSNLCNGRACVNRRVGGRVIGGVVDRVIKKKTPEIELSLSGELRERVEKELGTQLDEYVDKANTVVEERFWTPARRLDLTPRQLSVATTGEQVRITVLEDQQCGLAAPRPFRSSPDGLGVAALHSSLVTDFLNSFYVRRKNPEELDGELMQRLNTSLPIKLFEDIDFSDETRLTFDLDFPQPFQVGFENNRIDLTMRSKRIVLDENVLPGRDLTLSYRVSAGADSQLHFELQGAPRLSPPRDAGVDDPPELMQMIRDELLAGLLPEFNVDLNGLLSDDKPMPLQIARIASDQQWLVLSLDANRAKNGSQIASAR